jgi:hypothetical protein
MDFFAILYTIFSVLIDPKTLIAYGIFLVFFTVSRQFLKTPKHDNLPYQKPTIRTDKESTNDEDDEKEEETV